MEIIRKFNSVNFESSVAILETHKPVSPFSLKPYAEKTIPVKSEDLYPWAAKMTADLGYGEVSYVVSNHPHTDDEFTADDVYVAIAKFESGYGIVFWSAVGLNVTTSCTFNGNLNDFALFKAEFECHEHLKPLF